MMSDTPVVQRSEGAAVMTITANYLGMPLDISGLDVENLEYFRHCAAHAFHLQQCAGCGLVRYPPTTACPWCANPEARWVPVEGRGTVHSYTEVHHAIQPAFKNHTPYLILMVDLDTQRGVPSPEEAIRVVGKYHAHARADADLAHHVGRGEHPVGRREIADDAYR